MMRLARCTVKKRHGTGGVGGDREANGSWPPSGSVASDRADAGMPASACRETFSGVNVAMIIAEQPSATRLVGPNLCIPIDKMGASGEVQFAPRAPSS